MEECRFRKWKPYHAVFTHELVNDPNAPNPKIKIPAGHGCRPGAKLLVLGDPWDEMKDPLSKWCRSLRSPKDTYLLKGRLSRTGFALVLTTAMCLTILGKMYTTTSSKDHPAGQTHRVRLKYRSSPIADFGIVKGSVKVPADRVFTFYLRDEDKFLPGQNPDEHYWIYFTTLRGDVVYLDCHLFTFGIAMEILSEGYVPQSIAEDNWTVPAMFFDKSLVKKTNLHTEQKRFSVLRNTGLQEMILDSNYDIATNHVMVIFNFMKEVAGKQLSERELKMFMDSLPLALLRMETNLKQEWWKTYPPDPRMSIPGSSEYDVFKDAYVDNWEEMQKIYDADVEKERKERKARGIHDM